MVFTARLIQKWSRITQRNPDGFLAAAVSLFYFCSMGYALLLAMILAGLTHHVQASFNITVGVLLGAFGYGVSRRQKAAGEPVLLLLKSLLVFMGAGTATAVYLKVTDFGSLSAFWHVPGVYLLIASLGYGSGQCVGFFRDALSSRDRAFIGKMLKAGAGGIFLGGLCFAFLFYSRLGVITSLFVVAWLSSLAALFLVSQFPSLPSGEKTSAVPFITAHIFASVILIILTIL